MVLFVVNFCKKKSMGSGVVLKLYYEICYENMLCYSLGRGGFLDCVPICKFATNNSDLDKKYSPVFSIPHQSCIYEKFMLM